MEEPMDHHHGAEWPVGAAPLDSTALDPACGMTVDPETARAKGLFSEYNGVEYFFCSRGCKLDFDEDPQRYLSPGYVPSM
jgi:Cu+-exporting ATPase